MSGTSGGNVRLVRTELMFGSHLAALAGLGLWMAMGAPAVQAEEAVKPALGSGFGAAIAPMAKAPVLDGKIEPGEWDQAAGTTGLGAWNNGEMDQRQGYARLGWTEDRLYVLVVSEVPIGFNPGSALPRDTEAVLTTNPTLELWIDPNTATRSSGKGDLRYYQLLLDSAGNSIDACRDGRGVPDDRWDGHWETAIKIDPLTGMLVTEASIPFKDLGCSRKMAGRSLGVLLGYNFQNPFSQRMWMPLGNSPVGYDNPAAFPVVRLDPKAPTVQVTGLGERLLQGELDAQVALMNPGRACKVHVISELTAAGAEPVREDSVVELPAKGRFSLRVHPAAKQASGVMQTWKLTVTSEKGNEVYFADQRCWKPAADFVRAKWEVPVMTPADPKTVVDLDRYIEVFTKTALPLKADPALNTEVAASVSTEQCERAILEMGDLARLQRVLAKAKRGEPVTVGIIGGSVTQGAGASSAMTRGYAALFANWWKLTFPKSKLTYVNAAIGGTGSLFGTHRIERDLLGSQPELVIVEFSINDGDTEQLGQTYEGVMRQILRKPWAPAVISFTVWGGAGHIGYPSTWHEKVARHYALPMVSARVAVSPEIQGGQLKLEDLMSDVIHPNDRGHRVLAATLIHYFEKVVAALPEEAKIQAAGPVPSPILTDRFEQASIVSAMQLQVTQAKDYTRYLGKWCGGFKDSELTFKFTGAGTVTIGFERSSVKQMAQAEVRVDGGAPVLLDAAWGLSFSMEQYLEVASNLPFGEHTVTLKTMESPSNPWKPWVEKFDGFVLRNVMLAGPPNSK